MNREPSLRDKLSATLVAAFEADFAANGPAVIERMREKYPQHYLAIAAQLIAKAEEPLGATNFSDVESMTDIGRKLLQQLGLGEFQISDAMAQKAADANDKLVAELEKIAQDAWQ